MNRRPLALPLTALLLAPMLLAPSCTTLLVGGAAATGYVVGQDEREFSQIVDDGAITSSVKTKFIASDRIAAFDIDVDTYEGVVTLTGHVPSREIEKLAVAIARATNGVRDVISQLVIIPGSG